MSLSFGNIILWRHAQAHDGINTSNKNSNKNSDENSDLSRALTYKGQRQAKNMARWLTQHLITSNLINKSLLNQPESSNLRVVSSVALRAYQTAQALQTNLGARCNIAVYQGFNPNSPLQKVLAELNRLDQTANLVLIGHAPWIGQLAAHLLGIKTGEFTIKKSAIWWLRLSESTPGHYEILTVQTPILLSEFVS